MTTELGPRDSVASSTAYVAPLVALGLLIAVLALASDAVARHWWVLLVALVAAVVVEGAIVVLGRGEPSEPGTRPTPESAAPPLSAPGVDLSVSPPVVKDVPTQVEDSHYVTVNRRLADGDVAAVMPAADKGAVSGLGAVSGPGVHVVWTPKSSHGVDQHEDAWSVDPSGRVAAIADGASSAFMSREWATILTEAFVTAPPRPQLGAMREWVLTQAQRWDDRSIDGTGPGAGDGDESAVWWATEAHRRGSFATLLGVVVDAADGGVDGGGRWRCWAVGDSCVVQVRTSGGRFERVRSYPLDTPDSFGSHPDLVGTGGDLASISCMEATWTVGDVLLLMTDAVAEWALRADLAGHDVWSLLATATTGWSELVDSERRRGAMVDDDATVLRLPCG